MRGSRTLPRLDVVVPAPPDEVDGELASSGTALASDYFEAIENDPRLPTVTWVVGDRGTDSDVFRADVDDPLGLRRTEDDVRHVLEIVRESL